jgi:glycosyltransferase 2 family protein
VGGPVRRHLPTIAGAVLAVVALAFCVRVAAQEWDRVSDSLASATPAWLVVALALAAAAMLLIALRWRACLLAVGGEPPTAPVVARWYFAGELGKYLPGAVWPVVGRAELARRGGVSRSAAYASVALSLAALYGAPVLPLALLALHPRVVEAGRRAVAGVSRRRLDVPVPGVAAVARLLVSYLPAWVAICGCTLAVAAALDTGGSPWRLAGATVVAWLAGFAAVPVPAGAGIREVVFVALAGLPAGLAVAVAVGARLCFLVVDAAGGLVASVGVGLGRGGRPVATRSTEPAP